MKKNNIKYFIQLEKSNTLDLRYVAIGIFNKKKEFSGIVYGYEGGGEFSEALLYENKYIVDNNGGYLDFDEQEELLKKLIGNKYIGKIDKKFNEFIEFDENELSFYLRENIFDPNLFFCDGKVITNCDDDEITPSYGNTVFEENDKIESIKKSEILSLVKNKKKIVSRNP